MKNKTFRFLRFNPISKFLFSIKWIDFILRKLFVHKFHEEHYSTTSKNANQINEELNPILEKYHGFLGHGVALMLLRDNKLPQTQDLDYDIYDFDKIDQFKKDLNKLGYELFFEGLHDNKIKFLSYYKDGSYIDFFICETINNKFDIHTICCETINPKFKLDAEMYVSTKFISYCRSMTFTNIMSKKMNGQLFYLPKEYDRYFSEMYGEDWRVPKKHFNWAINPKNNLPKKVKNNMAYVSKKNYQINFND